MAKTRKKRDYGSMFKNTPTAALPTPEEVNKQVANLVDKAKLPAPEAVQETAPSPAVKAKAKAEPTPKVHPAVAPPPALAPVEESTRGRKPLEVRRLPYTTSLTADHKFNLKYHAMRKGIRPSDMLNQILQAYFKDNPI